MDKFPDNQGCINGQITRLIDKPDELKEFMKNKTRKQKNEGRRHARTVMDLMDKSSGEK